MTTQRPLRSFLGLAIALLLAANTGIAQQQGGGQTPAPAGGGTPSGSSTPTPTTPSIPNTPNIPGRPTSPTIGQPQEQRFPEMQRPIFLSGKVMMDDGSAVPDNVVIERVCNGVAKPEGYANSKGHFSFQLGSNMQVFSDASVSSAADSGFGGNRGGGMPSTPGNRTFSERDLMGCEIRATLAGYRSEAVLLTGRRFMDNPDVGVIILHRMGNVEGDTISLTTALAPKDAKKAYEKGREAMKKNKLADAQKELQKAVELYPKYSIAWYNLGLVKDQQKDAAGARSAFLEAMAADPKYVNPYLPLAQIAAQEKKWQEVADTTGRLIKLNAFDFPHAYFLNSVANLNLQKLDDAEKSAREALKYDTKNRNPKLHHVLGVILAQKQQFPEAATEMKSYLQFAPNASDVEFVKKQLADIERITGTQETAGKSQ